MGQKGNLLLVARRSQLAAFSAGRPSARLGSRIIESGQLAASKPATMFPIRPRGFRASLVLACWPAGQGFKLSERQAVNLISSRARVAPRRRELACKSVVTEPGGLGGALRAGLSALGRPGSSLAGRPSITTAAAAAQSELSSSGIDLNDRAYFHIGSMEGKFDLHP